MGARRTKLAAFCAAIFIMHSGASAERLPEPIKLPVASIADELASHIKATTTFVWREKDIKVDFVADGDNALIRAISPLEPQPMYMWIQSPYHALLILSEKRMGALWPALLEWAGSDLVKLRDRQIRLARAAYETGEFPGHASNSGESVTGGKNRAFLQYLTTLSVSGRQDEALTLIEAQLAKRNRPGKKMDLDTVLLVIRKATILSGWGDRGQAIALLREVKKSAKIDPEVLINLDVNLAAILVENKEYQAAFDLIESAASNYAEMIGPTNVPGSDRQFAWIRACALKGIGRPLEAMKLSESLYATPAVISGNHFVPAPKLEIVSRAAACMNDPAPLARLIMDEYAEATVISDLHVALQADQSLRKRDVEFYRTVYSDPALKTIAEERMQELAPELKPAVNSWRN